MELARLICQPLQQISTLAVPLTVYRQPLRCLLIHPQAMLQTFTCLSFQ